MTERIIPATIDSTGQTEAVVPLNAWRKANVRAGDTVIWPEHGVFLGNREPCYLGDQTRTKAGDLRGVIDEGNGSTVLRTIDTPYPLKKLPNGAWDHDANFIRTRVLGNFDVSRATGGIARDLYARGCNNAVAAMRLETEAQHGWNVAGCSDYTLDRCRSERTWGDPHYLGHDASISGRHNRKVSILNGQFIAGGRQGLGWSDCTDLRYQYNLLSWVQRTLIDIEPNAADKEISGTLADNIFGAHHLTFWSSGGGEEGKAAKVGLLTLARNYFKTGACMMLLTGGDSTHKRGPYVIRENVGADTLVGFGSPIGALIVIRNANGAVILNNQGLPVQAGRGMVGILAAPDVPVVYAGNDFPNAVAEFRRAA